MVLPKQSFQVYDPSHVFLELGNPSRGIVIVLHGVLDVVLLVERIIKHYEEVSVTSELSVPLV